MIQGQSITFIMELELSSFPHYCHQPREVIHYNDKDQRGDVISLSQPLLTFKEPTHSTIETQRVCWSSNASYDLINKLLREVQALKQFSDEFQLMES